MFQFFFQAKIETLTIPPPAIHRRKISVNRRLQGSCCVTKFAGIQDVMENPANDKNSALNPLQRMGDNIRLVRQSQGFSITLLANYAGISRPLLRRIEAGNATVSIGSIYAVLLQLGLEKDFEKIAFRKGLAYDTVVQQTHPYFRSSFERAKKRDQRK